LAREPTPIPRLCHRLFAFLKAIDAPGILVFFNAGRMLR